MHWSEVKKGKWVRLTTSVRSNGDTLPVGTRLKVVKAPQHPLENEFIGRTKQGKEYTVRIFVITPA